MKFSGLLLAELSGGETYRAGGVFGIGARVRKHEEYTVDKALERIGRALERLGISDVAYLWAGEEPIYEGAEGETRPYRELTGDTWNRLAALRQENDLSLAVLFEDDDFVHTLALTYTVDHDDERPGFVIDASSVVSEVFRDAEESDEEYRARMIDFWTDDEVAPRYEEALEEFMERLSHEFGKELGFVDEPDIYIELSNERDPELGMAAPITGLPYGTG